jgi:catechol 2,3-dioxygenase-like lactoylglutathione lyase family enzyme
MFRRLAHVCIRATDLAATERFYVDLLGLEKAFEFTRGGKRIGFYLSAGENTFIEVFSEAEEPSWERPLLRHFCLEVENLAAAVSTLQERRVATSAQKLGADAAWQAWITDPSGVRIELMQYSDDSSQFSGKTVALDS